MRNILTLAALALLLPISCTDRGEESFDLLIAENHPRLILDDNEFAKLRKTLDKGRDSVILMMHETEMRLADGTGMSEDTLKYEKDESGTRILDVSEDAFRRISSCAYAYRYTGDAKYLAHAEWDINTVCDFPDWNPSHYLDVAEMANAVAIGYDWLYRELKPETRAKTELALKRFAFDTAPGQKFYGMLNNWNQVCNSGLTVAALAVYEAMPETARSIIDTSVESNRMLMDCLYAPDGIYVEGADYWTFGSNFEALMLSCLEACLGGDFGLGDGPGFDKTGAFIAAATGNTGLAFNYSDGGDEHNLRNALWYIADRFGHTESLISDIDVLKNTDASSDYWAQFLPLSIRHALHMHTKSLNDIPKGPSAFHGKGENPMAVFRTGYGRDDLYLGIKGGMAGINHGHMDAGAFVYEADGIRWASDLGSFDYAVAEKELAEVGGNLWDRAQDSYRWDIFRYNNRQHSTITVNDHKFRVDGKAELVSVSEEPSCMSATFDLTPVYGGELASATRTAGIRDCDHLEVRDVLKAPSDTAACIRWTLVTFAEPSIADDGIILTRDGKAVKLSTSANDVNWRIWSSDPKDYESRTAFFEDKEKAFFCGFEVTVPAGTEWETVTTLKSLR